MHTYNIPLSLAEGACVPCDPPRSLEGIVLGKEEESILFAEWLTVRLRVVQFRVG